MADSPQGIVTELGSPQSSQPDGPPQDRISCTRHLLRNLCICFSRISHARSEAMLYDKYVYIHIICYNEHIPLQYFRIHNYNSSDNLYRNSPLSATLSRMISVRGFLLLLPLATVLYMADIKHITPRSTVFAPIDSLLGTGHALLDAIFHRTPAKTTHAIPFITEIPCSDVSYDEQCGRHCREVAQLPFDGQSSSYRVQTGSPLTRAESIMSGRGSPHYRLEEICGNHLDIIMMCMGGWSSHL